MTDQTIPTRTVHDAAGMHALSPGLVGFTPQESVVIVFMADSRGQLTARVDTSEVARPELMAQLGTVVVGSEHWVSLGDGRQHPLDEVHDHPVRVQEIYEGRCPARSRDELAALVQPGSDEVGEAFAVTAEAGLLALLAMGDEDVAGLAGEYLDVVWRERAVDDALAGALAALVSLDAGLLAALRRIDRDTAGDWRELWAAVVRRATGRLAYGSLVVAGTAAFVSGEGALLTTATEHAERLRGGHWGVEMLARINREVVNPSTWPQPLVEAGADVAV